MQLSKALIFTVAVLVLAAVSARGLEGISNGIEFAGTGYNILIANPLNSQTQDPGIRKQIFNFTYTQRKLTPDDKWPIPDQIQAQVRSFCNFQQDYNSYTGMQVYSKLLSQKINEGFGLLFLFSYSLGRQYQEIQMSFETQRQVQWSIDGSCEAYSVTVDTFDLPPLRQDFIKGLRSSFTTNNWEIFIDTYGTHFITQSVLGGRMSLLQTMNSETYSYFKLQKFNFETGARGAFKLITGFGSFSSSEERSQAEYFQKNSVHSSTLFLGPAPAPGSSISQWQQAVRNQPTPISYNILPLYELVTESNFPGLDKNAVKASMDAGLQAYCKKKGCTTPTRDPSYPVTAELNIYYTQLFGESTRGTYAENRETTNPAMRVCKVVMNCGADIDGLQLTLCDGRGNYEILEYLGGTGGGRNEYNIPYDENDYINGFQGTYYQSSKVQFIMSFQFKMKSGRLIPEQPCGSSRGSKSFSHSTPGPIVGIYGFQSDRIDRIGFYYSYITYPTYQVVGNY